MLRLNDPTPPQPVSPGIINDKYLTVQKAEELTGYNGQYLRRLLRAGHLPGMKVGQVWLIHFDALKAYFSQAINTPDE